MPFGAQGDNFAVEGGGDAAGHGDDHPLPLEDGLPLLEVGGDVLSHIFEPRRAAHQRLQLGPFRFGLLGSG
jgi:hypothetical protein